MGSRRKVSREAAKTIFTAALGAGPGKTHASASEKNLYLLVSRLSFRVLPLSHTHSLTQHTSQSRTEQYGMGTCKTGTPERTIVQWSSQAVCATNLAVQATRSGVDTVVVCLGRFL